MNDPYYSPGLNLSNTTTGTYNNLSVLYNNNIVNITDLFALKSDYKKLATLSIYSAPRTIRNSFEILNINEMVA